MTTLHFGRVLAAFAGLALSAAAAANEDRAIGQEAFEKACMACHGEPPVARAPSRAQLAKMPPEKILQAQLSGLMALQAAARDIKGLSERPDAKQLYAIADAWRPHRGVAAQLLWRYYGVSRGRADPVSVAIEA